MQIEDCFYRISVKALILNESRDKFLITKETNGKWELPGGGLDWGTSPQEDLPREISEEMGLTVTWVADRPSYFFTGESLKKKLWLANIVYEAKLKNLNFTPSDECIEIKFVNKDNIRNLPTFPNVNILANMFDPRFHVR